MENSAQEIPPPINGKAALSIGRANDCARFSLRIDHQNLPKTSKAFGHQLPLKIGNITTSGEDISLCLGPDEWFIWAPCHKEAEIIKYFDALYTDAPHSLVDIGHREAGIEIEGPDAATALSAGCPLDLTEMKPGTGTRTVFDNLQIMLLMN